MQQYVHYLFAVFSSTEALKMSDSNLHVQNETFSLKTASLMTYAWCLSLKRITSCAVTSIHMTDT